MKTQAKVVVVGGGVVGASVLYHLTKWGWKDVMLVEKGILTCGSTWHAAGGMHTINSDPNVAKLQEYTIHLYKELEEISGHSTGLHMTGGVMLAATPERVDYLKQVHARGKLLGMKTEFVDMDFVERVLPIVDTAHFKAALWDDNEGHVDPVGVTTAYAKSAKIGGAEIVENCRVLGIRPNGDKTWTVETEQGDITCEHVVNAGGLWGREVGRMVGMELPLQAMAHQYLVTEDMPAVKNRASDLEWVAHAIDADGECYMRQEVNGMLLGTYEKNGIPWHTNTAPWDFESELLPDDLEQIADNLEVAFKHFPALAEAGIKQVINGPFTFAPDGNPVVGPVPGMPGMWLATGVMAGFSQGGGVGRTLAEWMVEGEPSIDVWAMDCARFGDWATKTYAQAKVKENYGRRFKIVFPNEELTAARPLKTTPAYDRLAGMGAVFGAAAGMEYPLWFADKPGEVDQASYRHTNAHPSVKREVELVRGGVGLMELATFAKYKVTGPKAEAWLDGLLANRIPKPGRMVLAPMLGAKGKLLGDFSVANFGDHFMIIGSGAAEKMHLRWFWKHLPTDGSVTLEPLTEGLMGWHIAGPKARHVLSKVVSDDISNEAMKFFSCAQMDMGLVPARVCRVSFTGELGYEIYVPAAYHLRLFETLMAAGAELGIAPFGSRALNAMRLEKGFGSWARDYTTDYTPFEAGLDWAVAWEKGDFIGKEPASQLRGQDPKRKLTLLEIEAADADGTVNEPIYLGEEMVGFTTSGGPNVSNGGSLSMAYLKPSAAAGGNDLSVEILGVQRKARVVQGALVDPEGKRMRS